MTLQICANQPEILCEGYQKEEWGGGGGGYKLSPKYKEHLSMDEMLLIHLIFPPCFRQRHIGF